VPRLYGGARFTLIGLIADEGVACHVMADKLCPVVVGRDAQLRTLTECLSAAAEGGGRCVFVTGEPGIGKSRLVREVREVREVRALAEGRGAFVVMGRCVAGASVPYRPLTEALGAARPR